MSGAVDDKSTAGTVDRITEPSACASRGAGGGLGERYVSGGVELRLGDWRTVLADVERVDAIISDAPYSPRTHEGERGTSLAGVKEANYNPGSGAGDRTRNGIDYEPITPEMCAEFVRLWAPRTDHWAVIFGDDVSFAWWRDAWRERGWVVFAPVVWVKSNPPPRFAGDGPTSSCEYICVARPRRKVPDSGGRPGHYSVLTQMNRGGNDMGGFVGVKDLGGMQALVRDYSRPGERIVDPFAGTGTTLVAAGIEGRECIGAEISPETYARGLARLRAGWTQTLRGPSVVEPKQMPLAGAR